MQRRKARDFGSMSRSSRVRGEGGVSNGKKGRNGGHVFVLFGS
jgi:hypothetical protein